MLEADSAAILLSTRTASCVVRATFGLASELEHARPIPIGARHGGTRRRVARAAAVIADLAEVELVSPVLRERGINSLVAIPLIADDAVIGVVHAGSEAYAQFTDDDARLLELIAERIALAIRSAALIEAERAAQERLQFLSEASVALSSSLDLETTLRRTAQLATARFADAAVVDLVDGDSIARVVIEVAEGRLSQEVRDGTPGEPALAGRRRRLGARDPNGARGSARRPGHRPGAAGRRHTRAAGDRADARAAPAARPRLHAAAGARPHPRRAGADPYRARTSRTGDVETVRELAARAAVAVDNANLYSEAERGRDRLGFLAMASALLGADLDEGSALERLGALVVDEYADRCAFHLAGEEATSVVAFADATAGDGPASLTAPHRRRASGRSRRAGPSWRPGCRRRRAACIPS